MATDRITKQVIKYISDMQKKAKQMRFVKELKEEVEIGANGTQKYVVKEARIQTNMATCLKHKRQAERQYNESVSYKCWTGEAELEKNIDGSKSIKSLRIK